MIALLRAGVADRTIGLATQERSAGPDAEPALQKTGPLLRIRLPARLVTVGHLARELPVPPSRSRRSLSGPGGLLGGDLRVLRDGAG